MVTALERVAVRIAIVAIAALCACAKAGGGLPHVRVAVGGQNQMVYLPTTLAQQLGYYKEEGLDVELQDHAGGAKALQAMVGGSADVVSGFYDHTIQMAAEGRELVAFVAMLRFPGMILAVSPERTGVVTRIEDLKGKIAGVTTAGSSSQMMLTHLLRRHGVEPDSVAITAVGSAATAIAAMEHGKVDVAMMADPAFTFLSRRHPTTKVLADLRTAEGVKDAFGTDAYPGAVLYADAGWIRANRATTEKLARAITRTLAWMQAHPPREIAERMPKTFRGEDDALYTEALGGSMAMFSKDGVMAAEGAEAAKMLLTESMEKVRQHPVDVSKTFTNEFVHGR